MSLPFRFKAEVYHNNRKQIIQIKHDRLKIPSGFELGAMEKQLKLLTRVGLKPGLFGLQVQPPNRSASPPPVVQVATIRQLSSKHRVMV